ncbi:MAG: response regulator [Acidobacteriota bacterium]
MSRDQRRDQRRDPSRACGNEATILVADDDDHVRGLLRRVLEGAGFRVLEARDGEEALRIAGRHDGALELLVTDVEMPGIAGPALAERIRSSRPCTPVIYVTGNPASLSAKKLSGRAAVLLKPFDLEQLLCVIEKLQG